MIFDNLNITEFWEISDYAQKEYTGNYPTDEVIKSVEQELNYKLPSSYIELMRKQNGGIPKNTCFPTNQNTSWADDHIAITGIMGIGNEKPNSICGEFSSKFWIEEWGYPDIGVYICDCPSGGHDMILLDYSKCGNQGEPEVVHIDQEDDYKKTFLAKDFETFIYGLENEEKFVNDNDALSEEDDLEEETFSDDF